MVRSNVVTITVGYPPLSVTRVSITPEKTRANVGEPITFNASVTLSRSLSSDEFGYWELVYDIYVNDNKVDTRSFAIYDTGPTIGFTFSLTGGALCRW